MVADGRGRALELVTVAVVKLLIAKGIGFLIGRVGKFCWVTARKSIKWRSGASPC